jgi:hypothetical protein
LPDDKVERLEKFFRELHDEAEELLQKHEIYKILSYGWADEDTPDKEFIGLAIWQMSPPFKHDLVSLMGNRTPTYSPTKRDEILLQNGDDFVGAMLFARRSLGVALCFAAISEPNAFGGNEEFWQEYATTLMWLNIASDRLRDFFLMARFGQRKKQYGLAKSYSEPFTKAAQGASGNLQECLVQLSHITEELQKHRKDRDEVVHEVATITAHRAIELLRKQRTLANGQQESTTFRDEALPPAIDKMKLWYGRLVKAGTLIFEFEGSSRSS